MFSKSLCSGAERNFEVYFAQKKISKEPFVLGGLRLIFMIKSRYGQWQRRFDGGETLKVTVEPLLFGKNDEIF